MAQIIVCASQHLCIVPCGLSRSSRAAEAEGSLHTRDSPSYFVFLSFFRIMSPVKDNVGRGLNIALVNGELLIHPPGSPHLWWCASSLPARTPHLPLPCLGQQ